MARAPEPPPEPPPEPQSMTVMKTMLKRARDAPISCAAGIDVEGEPLLLLAHNRGSKMLAARMRREHEDAKIVLWGTAKIDMAKDPKTVLFQLNKDYTGMKRLLKKILKGTGYTKAEVERKGPVVPETE